MNSVWNLLEVSQEEKDNGTISKWIDDSELFLITYYTIDCVSERSYTVYMLLDGYDKRYPNDNIYIDVDCEIENNPNDHDKNLKQIQSQINAIKESLTKKLMGIVL